MKINRQELTILLLTCIFTCASTVSFARVATSASDNEILNRKCDEQFIKDKTNFKKKQDDVRQSNEGDIEYQLLQIKFMEQRNIEYLTENVCPTHPNASGLLKNARKNMQSINAKCLQKYNEEKCGITETPRSQEDIDNMVLHFISEGKKTNQNQSNNNSQATQNTANGGGSIGNAQISEEQCFQKLVDIQKQSLISERENRNNQTESLRGSYAAAKAQKDLFESECSHHRKANVYISGARETMQDLGNRCSAIGTGANCGVSASAESNRGTANNNNQNSSGGGSKSDDMVNQSQQRAESTQSKADAARQGKRKRHDPAAEATNCIQPIVGSKEDKIKNICNFEIYYTFCYYHPDESSFATMTTCEKQSFGAAELKPGKLNTVYKRAEKFYWHACKLPTWSLDSEYVDGKGIRGRCYDVGGSN